MLSIGPTELGATSVAFAFETSGLVNRQFADVTADGTIYCYESLGPQSYFVSLAADGRLAVEKVSHLVGSSPCDAAPATWIMSSAALTFIR